MLEETKDLILQGPFDLDMWDVTVVHKGKVVRLRLSDLGWKHLGNGSPSLLQEEVEKAFADRTARHEGPGHTGDCFGDTCSKECDCGKCPPLPEKTLACGPPTQGRG